MIEDRVSRSAVAERDIPEQYLAQIGYILISRTLQCEIDSPVMRQPLVSAWRRANYCPVRCACQERLDDAPGRMYRGIYTGDAGAGGAIHEERLHTDRINVAVRQDSRS